MTKSTKFREGSMGAAESKAAKNWIIGAGIILVIVCLLLYFNFPPNDLGKLQNASPQGWAPVSFIAMAVAGIWLFLSYKQGDLGKLGVFKLILILLLIIVAICFACNWDFDLAKIDRYNQTGVRS